MGDFRENIIYKKIKDYFSDRIDVVLSDMAANTTGSKDLDSFRSMLNPNYSLHPTL